MKKQTKIGSLRQLQSNVIRYYLPYDHIDFEIQSRILTKVHEQERRILRQK